jgi:aryl sulfotransferase
VKRPKTPKTIPHRAPERAYRSHFTDSTHWNEYEPRPGDIVISTPLKVGTTWAQRITAALVFGSAELPGPLMSVSPWLDCTYYPLVMQLMGLEAQDHRRFLKTHLPVDALPIYSEVSYLVVGRDLRDAAVSTFNHARGVGNSEGRPLEIPKSEDVHTPELPKIPEDLRRFWKRYFTRSAFPWETDGWPYNSPTHHLASWWELREEPNVLLLHYQDMLDDLDGQMRRVAAFLGIPVDEGVWPDLVTSCTFSEMKAKKNEMWSGQLGSSLSSFEFFHKGKSGQWQDALTPEDLTLYETAMTRVPADLRAWLEHGA